MPRTSAELDEESSRATELLQGKTVVRLVRHRETEVLVEFTDACRLFVDRSATGVELSISGSAAESALLTHRQAYEAMFAFLESQFRTTGSNDIAALLGSMSLLPDGSPLDPAHKAEWNTAVSAALSGKVESGFHTGS